jgi:hypothetical protein
MPETGAPAAADGRAPALTPRGRDGACRPHAAAAEAPALTHVDRAKIAAL